MDDLDALLADLQNSSRSTNKPKQPANINTDDFPPPPPGKIETQFQDTPPSEPKSPPPQVLPKPPIKETPSHTDSTEEEQQHSFNNLSELEGLLQDLDKASDFHRRSLARLPMHTSQPISNAQTQQTSSPATLAQQSNEDLTNGTPNKPESSGVQVSMGAVEALLDELDSTVSHSKTVAQPKLKEPSVAQRTGTTASTATKELDDLMASLSDFKVTTEQPAIDAVDGPYRPVPPPPVTATVTPTFQVSSNDDYAKVEKRPPSIAQKPKPAASSQQNANNLDSMLGSLQSNMSKQGVATVTKGTCAACNKPIIGQVCTALGKTWHPEHFACCICETELGTKTFFERDGKPYCEEDYHDIFAPKCFACNGPILDSCVTSMDRTWHPEHFVCTACGRPFGDSGYHEKDGKAYCREDYFKLFAPKCSGCNEAIIENYISALNGHWHPHCFACMECHQPFHNGSFFEHDGLPYCEMHYHARRGSLCYSCQKPITGRCITAMHRKFHPEHFICAFCLKQLNKGTFKEQNDKPYCHACFVKLFG